MAAVESQEWGGFGVENALQIPPNMEGRKTCEEDDCTRLAQGGDFCGGNICVTVMNVVSRFH